MSRPFAPSGKHSLVSSDPARSGVLAAAICYLLWGLVPLYWKRLSAVDAVELIAHRHWWSLALLALLLTRMPEGRREAIRALGSVRSVGRLFIASLLLTTNWLAYVWGVTTGRIVETSLGYFLVPLVSVLAGRFLLHEPLRRIQWIAVATAACGVGLMVTQAGGLPWIALILAGSWSLYSILRKGSPMGPIPGLAVETLLLGPAALAFLGWRHFSGEGALGRIDTVGHLLLLSSGLVTAVPLLFFAYAAPRIRLSTLGILQYIAPSLQFALGVGVYRETLSAARMISFVLIWIALGIYCIDGWVAQRNIPPSPRKT
jgi:chloramphenicol-sensitive protein RarD